MPTYEQVLNIEPKVTDGLAAIIGAATGLTTYTAFDASTKTHTPWIEVGVELGAATRQMGKDGLGNWLYNQWDVSITFKVVTKRSKSEQSDVQALARSRIRLAMMPFRGLFTTERLPFHQLESPYESGTVENVSTAEDVDASELRYNSLVCIRPDVLVTVVS